PARAACEREIPEAAPQREALRRRLHELAHRGDGQREVEDELRQPDPVQPGVAEELVGLTRPAEELDAARDERERPAREEREPLAVAVLDERLLARHVTRRVERPEIPAEGRRAARRRLLEHLDDAALREERGALG